MHRTHPAEQDRLRLRVDIKARWSEEESLLMARKEAELTVIGSSRFLNLDLAKIFTNRSVEAIKKARQKPAYREAVRRFTDELESGPSQHLTSPPPPAFSLSPAAPQNPSRQNSPSDRNQQFLDYAVELPPPRATAYRSNLLLEIVNEANDLGKDATLVRLSSYLLDIWPSRRPSAAPSRPEIRQNIRNRRQARRREYALTQRNWSKHQGRCIKSILDGPSASIQPPQSVMEPYWREVMERESAASPPGEDIKQDLSGIWEPITQLEIQTCKPPLSSSPGPDGITPRQLRAIPDELLVRILNIILWCGKLPDHIAQARTIFIPKKTESLEPADFRPITIPSTITRLLHGILAERVKKFFLLDPRQRAFQPTDGCADNTTLVDLLLRDHHQRYSSCYIAVLDVSKAFDSVSHPAIFNTLESYGFPEGFTKHLKSHYLSSSTRLVGDGWISAKVHPNRGVQQGDPLSPMVFNTIIDRVLKNLSADIGCTIGTTKVNALAFADDILLCASTPLGLQTLIQDTNQFLESCGLTINSSKCLTIGIKGQPKQKVTVIEERSFMVGNRPIPALKRGEVWRYLGISFSADGKCKYRILDDLQPKLVNLTRAPLKPQQRLHALRVVVVPQLHHKLTLGNTMIGSLNKADKVIRSFVRKWLDLPNDTPKAYFHASVKDGGLGIPSLRWNAPCLRRSRLLNLQLPNLSEAATANTFIAAELVKVERRLIVDGHQLQDKTAIESHWSHKLHESVDGAGLREANSHHQAHRWIREPTRLLSGRDYIQCAKLRINALPSRSRTTRGRHQQDRMCRAGCQAPETINHIVQQCHRTHAGRIDRHDSVVNYVERGAISRGFRTLKEPTIPTSVGTRKPDLIAISGRRALVVDAQVVTDGRSLNEAHTRKVAFYNTAEIKNTIKATYRVDQVAVTSATLNWRGIWSGSSIDSLLQNGVLKKKDSALISTRVAIGSIRCFRIFNATTSVTHRTGVG